MDKLIVVTKYLLLNVKTQLVVCTVRHFPAGYTRYYTTCHIK